jgi:hypothetical protein
VKSAVPLSRRPVGKPFLACAYAFIVIPSYNGARKQAK